MSQTGQAPFTIGGYEVVRELAADRTWLAVAPGGRLVVLKLLDDDCLWKAQLHPNIKDRLGRVRELAHVRVANLHGVERDGGQGGLVYMVWEFVCGKTLDEFALSPDCAKGQLLAVARELVLSIEMLHARGIVHGAIKPSNVIIDPDGQGQGDGQGVTLTHVSPLLYADPSEDLRAVTAALRQIVERRGESQTPLARLLEDAPAQDLSLRQLAGRIGALIEGRDAEPAPDSDPQDSVRIRRRTLIGAAATAVLGIALFAGLKLYAHQRTPKPPPPPQANPAALEQHPSNR
jgi:serine/threonine protein kinase